ncbi:hypothetical protein LCGC14_0771590 [marine sediment metagenome]|uniref:DNA-directed DNA polymerase n=1 Tax=marine sediment metagenome TaxID=412755 RepID=A0A0F9SI63_9ZZZZ
MITEFVCKKLSRLSGTGRPGRWLFLDTETKQQRCELTEGGKLFTPWCDEYLFEAGQFTGIKHRFKLGWTCFSRYEKSRAFVSDVWQFHTDTEKLWNYITSLAIPGSPLHIIGHNIFFDLQCSDFFYYLTLWGWCLDFYYDKGLTYILVIHRGKQRIKCLSSTNFFPFSLEKLGVMLKIPKAKVDFETVRRADLITYCKRDVLILRKAMEYYIAFLDDNNLGRFFMSRAGQAFGSFRYRFMDCKIYLHKDVDVTALEESGYFGGRVESRFLGIVPGKSFVHLDINSLYGFVMRDYRLPVKLIDHGWSMTVDKLSELLGKYCVMAKVDLVTDQPAYAKRYKNKLVFPTGKFSTTLCSEGLQFALDNDHIKYIGEYSVYKADRIFEEYVKTFYKLRTKFRKEDNAIMIYLCKMLLNYLYGKFAQKADCIEIADDITFDGYYREEVYDLVTGQREITTKMFNRIWRTFGREPSKVYFVAVAAHITEAARFVLYRYMDRVGINNVLYCDTDSLKIRAELLPLLHDYIDNKKLGRLKIEGRTKHLSIFGAKHYTTEKTTKIKGVPSKAEKIGDHKYKYLEFQRQRQHLRQQVTRFFVTREVTKTVKPYYDKGEVLDSGVIIPFHF